MDVEDIMFLIICIFELIYRLLDQCPMKVNISLVLTPYPKRFTSFPLTPHSINSGVTSYISSRFKEIFIFREEEWTKVLIHELLHAFHLTSWFHNSSSACIHDHYKNIYPNLKTQIPAATLESEAYTEYIAQLIYYTLHSHSDEEFRQKLDNGITYTKKQLSSLLYYSKCYKIENIQNKQNKKCKWTENTSAFGYYYMRYLLLRSNYVPSTLVIKTIDLHTLLNNLKAEILDFDSKPMEIGFSLAMTC